MRTSRITYYLGIATLIVSAVLFHLSGLDENFKSYGQGAGLTVALLAAVGSLVGIFSNARVTMSNLAGCLLLVSGGYGLWKAESFRELVTWSLLFSVVGIYYIMVARQTKRLEEQLREEYKKTAKEKADA